jgi:site-specific recombinase XerD
MAVREKHGKYIIDYYPRGRQGRRIVFRLPSGTTKEQADEIEKELRSKKNKQQHINPSGNISRLVQHYLKHCDMHQSSETVRDKVSYFAKHLIPYFGRYHISDLTNAQIMAYKQHMKDKSYRDVPLSNRTISKGLCYFSAFLKWAEEESNIAPQQPLRFRKLPHVRPMPIILSFEEVRAFIEAAEKPFNILFKMFFYLGLRNRAARTLRWDDIDWAKHALKTVEKGNKVKWHPIPDDLLIDLRAHYVTSTSKWIFASNLKNKPISNIKRAVKRAKEKAGIKKRIYPHLLRHSIATHLLDSDVDIRQIQSFLDHAQISTTEWYAQVSMEKKRQALEKAGIKTTKM